MDRLRVGFIGAGGNTRLRHLPGFGAIEGVELAAVANRSVGSAQGIADEFNVGRVEADWHGIIEADDIDAVCIGTWPNTHAEMTCAALRAGKHVLVEARMADSLTAANTMLEAQAKRADLVAQIVPSPMTLETDAIISQILADGKLGKLLEVRSGFANDSTLDPTLPLTWRMDHRLSGINTMALGICYEPIQRWLGGDAEVATAHAQINTSIRIDSAGSEHAVKIPERLSVQGLWGSARLEMSQSTVAEGAPRFGYQLQGTEGVLDYDITTGRMAISRPDGGMEEIEYPKLPESGWAVERDFVTAIREGVPVTRTDFSTGHRYMQFTDAVWQAWQ
ncbi:Gfo/Idh/MocA family oxidoreductase [Opitutaceae bacterium]|nr:Gfo/Idh/MocA family oxidoreductase [bacterium]MDB4384861.1 Gfo/Idh/MocA family oxidoreductase [Opitutaceae bacterium]